MFSDLQACHCSGHCSDYHSVHGFNMAACNIGLQWQRVSTMEAACAVGWNLIGVTLFGSTLSRGRCSACINNACLPNFGLTPAVGQLSGTPDTIAHGCCYDVVGSHKVVCHTMAREFEHVCTCRCTCWRLTPSMGLAVMAWHGAERDLLGTKSACCGVE